MQVPHLHEWHVVCGIGFQFKVLDMFGCLPSLQVPEVAEELHIFDEKWTASEDETLIEAVEQYGFGSWSVLAYKTDLFELMIQSF